MLRRISNEKKKIVPVRKEELMKHVDPIELDENVTTNIGITFVNDKTVNSKTYYDVVYNRLLETKSSDRLELSDAEINVVNMNRSFLNSSHELFQFNKELYDIIYSCVSNHLVSIINSILKYDIGVNPFIEKLKLEIDNGTFDPNPKDDNNNYDFMYHKYRVVFKSIICMRTYNALCDTLRDFDAFDFDMFENKIKFTHDNIYFTLHELLLHECMTRIECGVDIICTKFMHYRMNFDPNHFMIPIKFIEEK